MRKKIGVPVILIIWLLIGFVAAGQRGDLSRLNNCDQVATVIVTVAAGPLNYIGVDPNVNCPGAPEPS